MRKKIIQYLRILVTAVMLFSITAQTQRPAAREYQLKAAFLFNFSQFTEWPASAFSSAKAPLVIGILGEDPFGNYLDEIVRGEEVNGHPLTIRRYHTIEEISDCHILFVNLPKPYKLSEINEKLKGKNILSVGETTNFIKEGGMIQFFSANNKIQFQINPEAAKKDGLTISSKLLRLAEINVPKK